jgi:hypothetical protein
MIAILLLSYPEYFWKFSDFEYAKCDSHFWEVVIHQKSYFHWLSKQLKLTKMEGTSIQLLGIP